MNKLNEWALKNLGEWVFTYATLSLIIAVVLALVFIIIAVAVIVRKTKRKSKQANGNLASEQELRKTLEPRIRAELEPQIREELAAQAATAEPCDSPDDNSEKTIALLQKIDELSDDARFKQNRIEELEQELQAAQKPTDDSQTNDLYRQINELNQTVKEQENEINLLKAENSQIKAQALQQKLAEASAPSKPAQQRAAAVKVVPTAPPPQESAPVKTEQPVNAASAEEDEYDEYYNDYGDDNSAIKVTLKFDRLKNNWVIMRSDTERTYRRVATKQEALVIAKDLARRLHAQLAVHKKDGKFQKV